MRHTVTRGYEEICDWINRRLYNNCPAGRCSDSYSVVLSECEKYIAIYWSAMPIGAVYGLPECEFRKTELRIIRVIDLEERDDNPAPLHDLTMSLLQHMWDNGNREILNDTERRLIVTVNDPIPF